MCLIKCEICEEIFYCFKYADICNCHKIYIWKTQEGCQDHATTCLISEWYMVSLLWNPCRRSKVETDLEEEEE